MSISKYQFNEYRTEGMPYSDYAAFEDSVEFNGPIFDELTSLSVDDVEISDFQKIFSKKYDLALKQYEKESNGSIKLLALTSCFQMTTMYSIIESEEWCKSIGVEFHIRFLEGPRMHSVTSLSDAEKISLIEYYKQYLNTSKKANMIIKHLENHIGPNYGSPREVTRFIQFMNYLDTTRNTDWKSKFPEVCSLVEKYNPTDVVTINNPGGGGHMQ
jgi:hypothetical protein